MTDRDITRRNFAVGAVATTGLALAWRPALAKLAMPTSPVDLNIVDVAGNLALTQKAIEAYAAAKTDVVGRVDIDLVLTGTDALSAGITQGLWITLLPDHEADLPRLQDIYQPAAWNMQG